MVISYRPVEGLSGYRVGDDGSVWMRRVRGLRLAGYKPLTIALMLRLPRAAVGHVCAGKTWTWLD